MTVLVGTASWTDKTLLECGRFYPADCKTAEARLRHYASIFPMVEVDSSYYAIPSINNVRAWAERTPADFVFNIKAFRLFTGHQTEPKVLGKDIVAELPERLAEKRHVYANELPGDLLDELWRRYLLAIEPLQDARKLKAVLFQFAPWVVADRDGHAYVRECVERMRGQTVAVEFRNKSWFERANTASTLEFMRGMGVVHVVVDAPQVTTANRVPAIWDITTPRLAILRLHGRNHRTWNVKGGVASDRFDYDYTEQELAALVPDIQALERRVEMMQVIFNNNKEDQGQRNSATLMELLDV